MGLSKFNTEIELQREWPALPDVALQVGLNERLALCFQSQCVLLAAMAQVVQTVDNTVVLHSCCCSSQQFVVIHCVACLCVVCL